MLERNENRLISLIRFILKVMNISAIFSFIYPQKFNQFSIKRETSVEFGLHEKSIFYFILIFEMFGDCPLEMADFPPAFLKLIGILTRVYLNEKSFKFSLKFPDGPSQQNTRISDFDINIM
jgi:hypothetical protein